MPQVTAIAHVFPSANDLYGALPVGSGKISSENNLTGTWMSLIQWENAIMSGGVLPGSSGSLTIQVPTGRAFIGGRLVSWQATNVTLPASSTSHLWVRLMLDGNSNASSVVIEHNTSGTTPNWYTVKLGTATTSGSAVTSTVNTSQPGIFTQAQLGKPSVGTAELIDANVTNSKLKTATGSASAFSARLSVTMNDYTFAYSTWNDTGSNLNLEGYPANDPGNTVARVSMAMEPAGSGNNGIRWRYLTASDDPTIWALLDPVSGEIKGTWVSDDPLTVTEEVFEEDPDGPVLVRRTRLLSEPPIAALGLLAQPVPLATLAQLALPQRMLDAADRHIERKAMKPANRLYRALQFHARDLAPSSWLLSNCAWDHAGGVIRECTAAEKARIRTRSNPTS